MGLTPPPMNLSFSGKTKPNRGAPQNTPPPQAAAKVWNMGQGFSRIAAPGEKLKSTNHITCYNVMVVNLEKGTSYMAHVWEGGYNGMSPQQIEMLKTFTPTLGRQVALIVEGARSSPSQWVRRDLEKLGIEVLPLIQVDSSNMRWDVDYDPAQRHVKVTDERGKLLYEGTPFPPFEEIPAAEKGLSDSERLFRALHCIEDPKTKEITKEGQSILLSVLKRRDLEQKMRREQLDERAVAAGYENYCDYMEADRNNFIDVAPDSPELMLRFLTGNVHFFNRYLQKKGNRKRVSVTRQKVMALFKNHPAELKEFVQEAQAAARKELQKMPLHQPSRVPGEIKKKQAG